VILYLVMYLLMFSGAIYLRYNMKKANRPFRIGKKGNGLMWFVGGLGLQKNHLYMATVDSRGVQASANSTKLLVRGNYSVQ
jgi:hypothetical protein